MNVILEDVKQGSEFGKQTLLVGTFNRRETYQKLSNLGIPQEVFILSVG